ncbi:MAG: MFS transporter [Chloroflexi bacterium]|nr:MFS transporter [Chloroflexota bacterium]
MIPEERRVVALAGLAHGVNHTAELTYAAVLAVLVAHFQTDRVLLGLFATVFALAYGVTALPSGFLADKIGAKRTMALSLAGGGVAALLVAGAPTLWFLGASLVLLGATAGLYHPAGVTFISQGVRLRSRAFGYHGVAGNIGLALAPPVATLMMGLWSWRAAFLLVGFLFGVSAVVVHLVRARPQEDPLAEGRPASGGASSPGASPGTWRQYLGPLVAVYAITLCNGLIYRASLTYLPTLFREELSVALLGINAEDLGGVVAGVAIFFGAVGQYAGGLIGDRYRREFLLLPLALVVVGALWAMGFSSGPLLLLAASLFTFFHFMGQPLGNSLIADYTPGLARGRMYAIMFMVTFGTGSLGGVIGGWIAELTGGVAWVFPAAGTLGVGIVALSIYLSVAALGRARRWSVASG